MQHQLAELTLDQVSDDIAKPILSCYHYLMSFRHHSIHLGLRSASEKWPSVVASLSPFDLDNIRGTGEGGEIGSVLVLSRVYAFPDTPKNAISFMLSRVRRWIALNRPDVTALVTYCNPNMGFTGSSYRADNWQLLGLEHGTRYRYFHGDYVTERRFVELLNGLRDAPSNDFGDRALSFSVWPLMPLRLYFRKCGRQTALRLSEPHHFEPWRPIPD